MPLEAWLYSLTIILLLALSVYSWRRRTIPGAKVFWAGCLLYALWLTAEWMVLLLSSIPAQIFWSKVKAASVISAATATTCFLLDYAQPGRWLTRRNLALLSLAPLLLIVLILTDPWHHWIWSRFTLDGRFDIQTTKAFWMFLAYSYALMLVSLAVLAWLLRSAHSRAPILLMLTGIITTRLVFLLDQLDLVHFPFAVNPIIIGFLFLMFAIALFAFRIFDPIRAAHQRAIDQMRAGVIVIDTDDRIASLNPAAEELFHLPAAAAKGRPVHGLLPAFTEHGKVLSDGTEKEIEFAYGNEQRSYTLSVSSLKDWRGLLIGRLLVLSDITEQKRTQALIVNQQRARAALEERERLARDLHDTLVQSTAAVRMQAETACMLLDRGLAAEVESYLNGIADAAHEMHCNLRRYIADVQAMAAINGALSEALRAETARFEKTWRIPVELHLPAGIEQGTLGTALELQLLRIVQEALANAGKHAQARHVHVALELGSRSLRLTVEDDGVGFTPQLPPAQSYTCTDSPGMGFGLRSMQARVESLGGDLQICSAPGCGTKLAACIPLEGCGEAARVSSREKDGNPAR